MKVLLITGLPASGKSTLAKRLSQRYAAPLIAKDCIKEPLLDVLGAETPAQSRKLSDASFAVMFALARELVQARTSCILEGNFRPGEHEPSLLSIFDKATSAQRSAAVAGDEGIAGYAAAASGESATCDGGANGERVTLCRPSQTVIAQVLCRTGEAQRLERLAARGSDPSRHPGHRDAHLLSAAAQVSDDFLSLPGERMLYEGDERTLIALDAWWRTPV